MVFGCGIADDLDRFFLPFHTDPNTEKEDLVGEVERKEIEKFLAAADANDADWDRFALELNLKYHTGLNYLQGADLITFIEEAEVEVEPEVVDEDEVEISSVQSIILALESPRHKGIVKWMDTATKGLKNALAPIYDEAQAMTEHPLKYSELQRSRILAMLAYMKREISIHDGKMIIESGSKKFFDGYVRIFLHDPQDGIETTKLRHLATATGEHDMILSAALQRSFELGEQYNNAFEEAARIEALLRSAQARLEAINERRQNIRGAHNASDLEGLDLDALETVRSRLENEIEGISAKIPELVAISDAAAAALQDILNLKQAELGVVTAQIEQLEIYRTALVEHTRITAEANTVQSEIDLYRTQFDNLTARIGSLETDCNNASEHAKSVHESAVAVKQAVASLTAEVRRRVAGLRL